MYQKSIVADFKAGIVVFLVALPLCLGIAMACGVTLFSGIIAGVIGGIIVTLFSGSKFSVTGPAAGLTAIVITSVSQLGSYQAFIAAVVFAGILQILLGLLKAGGIGNFVPNAVIKAMLAGIGIILIFKQIPHFFGYDKDAEGDFGFEQADGHNTFSELIYMFDGITPGALIIGVISFIILKLSEKDFYKNNKVLSNLPAPLLVVAVGIGLTLVFNSIPYLVIESQHLVSLPTIKSAGDLKSNLVFPDFTAITSTQFWTVVVTIGIVASLETLLNIEATEKLDPEKNEANSNRELIAQGVGNIASGLVGGLPVTSVIVRSAANINAGAKTKLSTILHAVLLLLSVLLIPNILMLIPNACLAAILIVTGYKLAKVSIFKEQYKHGIEQFVPFVITIIVMLSTDLLKGVGAGIIVAIVFIIRDNIISLFDMSEDKLHDKRHYMIKLPQHVTFFNKGFLINYFDKIKPDSVVIIDGSINKKINRDAKDVIEEFIEKSKHINVEVQLIKINLN